MEGTYFCICTYDSLSLTQLNLEFVSLLQFGQTQGCQSQNTAFLYLS